MKLANVASEVNPSPSDSADESLNKPTPPSDRRSAGPGFYSVDSGLTLGHASQETEEDLDPLKVPNKRRRPSSRDDPSIQHTSSSPVCRGVSFLHGRRGYSTGSVPGRASRYTTPK